MRRLSCVPVVPLFLVFPFSVSLSLPAYISHMGKVMDKRMTEVGAERFYDLGCADESGEGLEVTVEPWTEGLFEKLKELLGVDGEGGDAKEEGDDGEAKAE